METALIFMLLILVQPGTYDEAIDFRGKGIALTGGARAGR